MRWCIDYFNTSSSDHTYGALASKPEPESFREKIKEAQLQEYSPHEHRRTPLRRIKQNVKQSLNQLRESSTRRTMRRFPPRPYFPYKHSVLPRAEMTNGYSPFCLSMPPPVTQGDSFSGHMAEIEFWVKTHRAPCTYGMPLPPQEQNVINAQRAQNILVSTKVEENKQKNDSDIKRPIDPPDVSPVKSTRKKLLTLLGDDSEPRTSRELFPSSGDSPHTLVHKTNGTIPGIAPAKSKPPRISVSKNVNGDVSSESTKKSRARPTSTPLTNRLRNIDAGKKAKSVANKTTPKRTRTPRTQQKTPKPTAREKLDLETESPTVTAGPSNTDNVASRELSRAVAEDSDTSVLTAPYIRSTRNSASKSKCQTLTRQRASLVKANKCFPPRAAADSDVDLETSNAIENRDATQQKTPESTAREKLDLETESPAVTAGPSNTENFASRELSRVVAEDSDTSVLTSPYIHSTPNSVSKTKCQTLTRQRASLAKANKFFPPIAAADSDVDLETSDPIDNRDASAHDTSGALNTTDSSLEIFPDISKSSKIKSKKVTRVLSVKNVQMLHFAGSAISSNLKRRSEPVVTRLASKRAKSLLWNGQANDSIETNEEQMSSIAGNLSAPCVARIVDAKSSSRGSLLLDSDESTRRKKYFV